MRKKMFFFTVLSFFVGGSILWASNFGIVVDFSGIVKYKKSPNVPEWSKVSYFMDIPEGAMIKTGNNSTVVIQKMNGKLIRLMENAEVELKAVPVKDNLLFTKIVKVPESIDKTLQEKINRLKIQFALKKTPTRTYSYKSFPAPVPTSPGQPTKPVLAPLPTGKQRGEMSLFIPARSLVRPGNICFAWEGGADKYNLAIYQGEEQNKPLYTEEIKGLYWVLPNSSGIRIEGGKYRIEIQCGDTCAKQEFEVIGKDSNTDLSRDMKYGRIIGKPEKLSSLDLIMLGTLYEKYGLFNDALHCYQILREKNSEMAEVCISELKNQARSQ